MKTILSFIAFFAFFLCSAPQTNAQSGQMFRQSTSVEKERPELNEETKKLIAAYRQNPTPENKAALRKQTEINYDKVVARENG